MASNKIIKAAGLVVNEQGRVMMSRDFGAKYWSFPGGGKDSEDESDFECLKREFKEEMDIELKEEDIRFYCETPEFPAANDPGKTVKSFFYFVDLHGQEPKPMAEVETIKWFSIEDFKREEESGNISHLGKDFMIPKLIADGIIK